MLTLTCSFLRKLVNMVHKTFINNSKKRLKLSMWIINLLKFRNPLEYFKFEMFKQGLFNISIALKIFRQFSVVRNDI